MCKHSMAIASGSDARQTLPAQLDRVERGDEVEITRHGRVLAVLAVTYALHASDAAHLATAVGGGATWFITNNRKDVPHSISEIDIVCPDQLPGYA